MNLMIFFFTNVVTLHAKIAPYAIYFRAMHKKTDRWLNLLHVEDLH